MQNLVDLGSKINVMNPNFAKKLGLQVCKTKISAQKINGSKLNTFCMVIAFFSVKDKDKKSCFLEEKFLLADMNMDITLGMLFLILSKVEIVFVDCHIN